MSDKLEKLTKQIYDEGINKAQQEAAEITAKAEQEKKKILRSARQEAEDIVNLAKKEAEELKNRVESELRMSSSQSLALLRQKISELICEKVSAESTSELFNDPGFLKKTVEIVMKEWISSHCLGGQEFYLKLPADLQAKIKEYFLESGKKYLDKGLKIQFDAGVKSGFVISPANGRYRIGFTEEDFRALITYFLRPQMKKFLFGTEESKK